MVSHVVHASLKGGDALLRHLTTVAGKLGPGATVRVGFLESETYEGGTYHFSKAALKGMSKETRAFAQFLQGKPKFAGHVAQVAYWQEYGTKKIPARPFMRHTIASKSPRWGNALGQALRSNNYNARAALATMGEGIQGQIRQSITDWSSPPNSKITRELKGNGKVLINSGQMRAAVDYQVLEVGEED